MTPHQIKTISFLALVLIVAMVAATIISAKGQDGNAAYFPIIRSDYGFWALQIKHDTDYAAIDLAPVDDGGMLVAGWTGYRSGPNRGLRLERLDAMGHTAWSVESPDGSLRDSGIAAVRRAAGGNFLVLGNNAWLMQVDNDGAVKWQKSYSHPVYRTSFQGLTSTADGAFILVGTLADPVNDNYSLPLVIKVSASGEVQWAYTLAAIENTVYYSAIDVAPVETGHYVVLMHRALFSPLALPAGWLVKLDDSGNVHWSKSINGLPAESVFARDLAKTQGSAIVVGGTSSSGSWLAKLDSMGNISWQNYYQAAGYVSVYTVDVTADGGYLVAGEASSARAWLARLDGTGDVVWSQFYDGADIMDKHDYVSAVREAPGGAILLAVRTLPTLTAEKHRAQVYKLDRDGLVRSCQAIEELPIAVQSADLTTTNQTLALAQVSLEVAAFDDPLSSAEHLGEGFCPAE